MVAETIHTSTGSARVPPRRRTTPSSRTLSSFACRAGGKQPDLVEEQRPAMRDLEEPGLGLARVRERAALVAEQLGLEQGSGIAAQLTSTNGAARAGARPVHGPRDEALARAGLAAQEDRRGTRGGRRALQNVFELLP